MSGYLFFGGGASFPRIEPSLNPHSRMGSVFGGGAFLVVDGEREDRRFLLHVKRCRPRQPWRRLGRRRVRFGGEELEWTIYCFSVDVFFYFFSFYFLGFSAV